MHATNYKLTELMVVRCAKEINDNEVVFAGVGLPLVVVSFAMATHAPNMILFTEGRVHSSDGSSGTCYHG